MVDALRAQGIDTVFCVPGDSCLEVLDALYAERGAIRVVTCRHEGAASFMAEAQGKLGGQPGVCLVSRGPGAANASIGVHTAFQDSTPMILLIGQVGRDMSGRDAFQEIDYRTMYGGMAKWVAQIDSAARIPEYLARAFGVARSGRPGPVVLALPEDMLTDSEFPIEQRAVRVPVAYPDPAALRELHDRLGQAKRPLLVLGGAVWCREGCEALARFARRHGLPVACSFRRQDLFDNRDACYVGDIGIGMHPALAQAVQEADLLIVVGARLGEITTCGYTLLNAPYPSQTLVHVLASAEELGKVFQPTLAIQSGLSAFAIAAAALMPVANPARDGWRVALRECYERYSTPLLSPARLDPACVVASLAASLAEDAILTSGEGNYSAWLHRYHRYTGFRTQLAPANGAMGYGVPAAIAAKLMFPSRQVVCLAGDGCFMMTAQELSTVRSLELAIVFLVFNNGMYGTIRMHQEASYPGRPIGTDLRNPDFVAFSRSFGIPAERIETFEDFPSALARAVCSTEGYLIELALDPEFISPRQTLSDLRRAALLD